MCSEGTRVQGVWRGVLEMIHFDLLLLQICLILDILFWIILTHDIQLQEAGHQPRVWGSCGTVTSESEENDWWRIKSHSIAPGGCQFRPLSRWKGREVWHTSQCINSPVRALRACASNASNCISGWSCTNKCGFNKKVKLNEMDGQIIIKKTHTQLVTNSGAFCMHYLSCSEAQRSTFPCRLCSARTENTKWLKLLLLFKLIVFYASISSM